MQLLDRVWLLLQLSSGLVFIPHGWRCTATNLDGSEDAVCFTKARARYLSEAGGCSPMAIPSAYLVIIPSLSVAAVCRR
jgi:hypothetical protein